MKHVLSVLAVLAAIVVALLVIQHAAGSGPITDEEAVRQVIQSAMNAQREAVLDYLVYVERIEQIRFSADGGLARATLLSLDPATGQPIEQEPGLAFARWDGENWVAILPADPAWIETVRAAPGELLGDEEKDYWNTIYTTYLDERPLAAISGYYLPWAAGESKYLSQSVGHDQYTPSGTMHYAFDFALNGTHWPIHASRPGTVWLCKEDIPTCTDWTCNQTQAIGNYIVLKDTTTTPTTYQLYLHLDYNSIPDNLCNNNQPVVGASVSQSQIIGVVDNTGQSWGSHLHFQVHTRSSSYFGTAVDFTYDDVSINGGRPRRQQYDAPYCKPEDACSTFQTYYVSGNTGSDDKVAPTGNITNLTDGATLSTATLSLQSATADIGDGVASVQFLAYFQDAWRSIGAPVTSNPETAALNWDWCASNVPDGIVSVALRITDRANNTTPFTGLHHVIKSYVCPKPPPTCTPSATQVALFSEPGYAGSCTLFSAGTSTSLGAVGNDNTASILVGASVKATLFDDTAQTQRGETFLVSDSNLADNLIGMDTASALLVQTNSTAPSAALLRVPAAGAVLTQGDVATFGWDNGGGATQYRVIITGTKTYTSPWLTTPYSFTNALPAGSYTWSIQPGSTARSFTVAAAPAITTTLLTLPFSETFETNSQRWSGSGLWMRTVADNRTPGGSWSWWYQQPDGDYDNGTINFGSLTSVPITIPVSGGPYYLRFFYKVETESPYPYWDQRWLQISSNGGLFANIWQAGSDPTGLWLNSPAFDLTPYAGQSIRLRFSFHTLDALRNAHMGWGIDDISITNTAPPACAADTDGVALTLGVTQNGTICPNGDVDTYTFTGNAGDEIGINVNAKSIGSALDSVLTLLDANGKLLAENDDQVTELNQDSLIRYKLPASGVYTVQVRAWDHPSAGGSAYNYTVRLFNDSTRPTVALTYPVNSSYLPNGNVQLTATASDAGSGVESVAFYWHNNDWLNGKWQFIGVDANGADGWQVTFNAAQPDQLGVAVYARAFDQAGNESVSAAWNITLDHTLPVSQLVPQNVTLGSNALLLQWTGSDNLSGLQRYDLQRQANSGSWTDYLTFPASSLQSWLILPTGASPTTYGFRLRAVDNADNAEAWPASAEVTAILPALNVLCSTPDMWEQDNTIATATLVTTDTLQLHNFCNPLAVDFTNDEDWLKLPVTGGQAYLISVTPTDQSAAVVVEIYASDGTTRIVGPAASPDYGAPLANTWIAPANGINYIRLRHVNGAVIGNATHYAVQVGEAKLVYLPFIRR
jgi:murein DD-endopeptidase MepM/ murein hydrolase activator NlpD